MVNPIIEQLVAQQALWRFTTHSNLPIQQEVEHIAALFAPEIRRYCELIQSADGASIGVMVRGEQLSFTTRAQQLMRTWKMPDQGIERYTILAERYQHKRTFLKLEWHQVPATQSIAHVVAGYVRHRPAVESVIADLQQYGIAAEILETIAQVADLLNKRSVHFVATSMQPDQVLSHKLYFSQYVTADQAELVVQRLRTLMGWFSLDQRLQDSVIHYHHALIELNPPPTLFVSISFTDTHLTPSIKIDYPQVAPAHTLALSSELGCSDVYTQVQQICGLFGKQRLSYLGMRLSQLAGVRLKYYLDIP